MINRERLVRIVRGRWKVFAIQLVAVFLLAACLPEGVRLPQSPLLKRLERKSGLIAYLSPDGNIFTIDQAGDNQHALTEDALKDALVYHLPIWSPQKRQFAYIWLSLAGDQVEEAGIRVAGPDIERASEVFSSDKEFPLFAAWSPDGERLSFSTSDGSSRLERLRIAGASGGESTLLDIGSSLFWDWSPDSSKILLHAGGSIQSEPQAHLSMLNVASELVESRWELPPADFDSPDWWRENGVTVAAQTGEGKASLVTADSAGEITQSLADLDGQVSFGWSPDGKHLAYLLKGAGTESPDRLTVINPYDLNDVVDVQATGLTGFFWSPDSRRIAYLSAAQPADTRATEIVPSKGAGSLLDLRVLDLETGTSKSFSTFVPTDLFANFLEEFDHYQHSATIWSPDSQNLVIAAYDSKGKAGIFIIDGSGSLEPRYLTPGLVASWSWK